MSKQEAIQATIEILKRDLTKAEAANTQYRKLLREALERLYHLSLNPEDRNYAYEIIEKIEQELKENDNE